MECRELRQHLIEILDAEADGSIPRAVQDHLSGCAACTRALGRYRRMASALSALPPASAPPGLLDDVRREIEKRRRSAPSPIRRRRAAFWVPRTAAAIAAGLLVYLAFYLTLPGPTAAYRVVAVDETVVFPEDDLALKGYLEGSWGLENDGDPVTLYSELAKDRGR
jgi:anti-sigma factor RsiW